LTEELENASDLHCRKAESGLAVIKQLSTFAKEKPGQHHTIAVILQQTFPAPRLTAGSALHKQKLWTYNLVIHNCGNDKGCVFGMRTKKADVLLKLEAAC
jgi:hypothetical protein